MLTWRGLNNETTTSRREGESTIEAQHVPRALGATSSETEKAEGGTVGVFTRISAIGASPLSGKSDPRQFAPDVVGPQPYVAKGSDK